MPGKSQRGALIPAALALVALSAPAAHAQQYTYTVLYSLAGPPADGANPVGLIRDSEGNFYGVAGQGGAHNLGALFKLAADGAESVLYSFPGYPNDGTSPTLGLVRDAEGNLYGTTFLGGAFNYGTVFKLDTAGVETILHNFTGAADGGNPGAGLLGDGQGNLYGPALYGGTATGFSGNGVIFKIDAGGTFNVLYTFTGGADGANPGSPLIFDAEGNLYGASAGGAYGWGTVFKLGPRGAEKVLYAFTGGADGSLPTGPLVRDSAGNLYGATSYGGMSTPEGGDGVVFKLDTAGTETVLHTFTGLTGPYTERDGANPGSGLVRDSAGNLYGTTYNGGHSCFYCGRPGRAGYGVVFKVDTAGNETILHRFAGKADGSHPLGLVRDSAGNLYGPVGTLGASGYGLIFQLAP